MQGVVASFDAARGDGWFLADSGERFYFHCVTIADGTRLINEGVRAVAERSVGRLGRDEVTAVAAL